MRSRLARALALLPLTVALVACGGKDEPSPPSTAATSSAGASTASPSTSAETEETVEPATGPRMDEEFVSLRLPAGLDWDVRGEYASVAADDGLWRVNIREILAGSEAPFARMVKLSIDERRELEGRRAERLENRVVDGLASFVVEDAARTELFYEVGTVVADDAGDQYRVAIEFIVPGDNPKTRAAIESTLATVDWG